MHFCTTSAVDYVSERADKWHRLVMSSWTAAREHAADHVRRDALSERRPTEWGSRLDGRVDEGHGGAEQGSDLSNPELELLAVSYWKSQSLSKIHRQPIIQMDWKLKAHIKGHLQISS